MSMADSLQRFIKAQAENYDNALSEVMNGKKRSHWMWYIFPQIHGLGSSENFKVVRDKRYVRSRRISEKSGFRKETCSYLQCPDDT